MIESFSDKETEKVWKNRYVKRIPKEIHRTALRKLIMIHAATNINDLRIPPGNKLEALKGDRKGQYSIRINKQYRICFKWSGSNAYDVEITDYH